ncbi:MAG: TonB-dependent receptor [Alphaproteobacteria bacterium]|nr:TonB-dependent receptor [Alphaproteobacteria bacterium]MBU1516106.1 TonB-dependent receptor [Alphaproteobacteria bacterium]MBU2092679.1 TonB-dependent receptor [Alphaproteobacteria bacterium]MBU2153796.1 TonB-dependent receptor [Alphaproteobacteria bacterium]MBU2308424.1 TonB-dependent receptor [Alphaproteobacteria bacterium]
MRAQLRGLLCASAALSAPLLFAGTTAQAQITDGATEVGELIVTAQKRAENIQAVPAAITAITGAALSERGITQPSDLQFIVPSMQAGRLLGQTSITIRGVGLNQGSPGVAIHVDGVYQPRPSMGDLTQIDIERVEVLRGPQGTLYGRNANGGVINFVTQAPTDKFEGYVLGSYASYQDYRLQGVVNLPLGDRLRARLVVDRTDRNEGFVKNVIPGGQDVDKGQTTAARLRVSADLTDKLKLDLAGTVLTASGPTSYFTLYNTPTATAVARNPYLARAIVPLAPRRISANDPIDDDREYYGGSATLAWDLGDFQLKAISGYSRIADRELRDDDAINLSAFPTRRIERSRTFTQEVNLSGSMGPLDAVVGAFYMRDHKYEMLDYDFPLGIFPLPANSDLHFETYRYLSKATAVFGDATFNLSDRARIIGGLRYSRDKQTNTQRNYLQFGNVAPRTLTCPLQTNEVTFHSTTPRVGAQYDVSDDSNLYATFSKGFKVGGFNFSACNQQFRPEKVTSYEAGWKNRLGGNLIVNASAFYYDYTDLQLVQVVGLTSLITNAAAARVKGVEVETIWRPESHWTVNANLSLLSAKFTRFVNTDSLAPALGPQDVSGNTINNAPKVSANIGLAYRSDPILFDGRITARADLAYRSKIYFREFNDALDAQKSYAVLNAALIWDSPDDAYRVRLFVTNLTGEDYIVRMSSSDNFGSRFVARGAPRQVGVELKANF